ncbi:MAG: ribonuclease P protein component [Betaproteobacteria bacterium]|nr:ribonuclease P protein component [Betaproteobacteria bacterium]
MSVTPLGPRRRLTDSAVFQTLLRQGRRLVAGPITVRLLNAGPVGRIGLSIAKRHLKKATDRNAVKRMAREAYRLRGQAMNGVDVLILLSEGAKARDAVRQLPAELKVKSGRRRVRSAIEAGLDQAEAAAQSSQSPRDRTGQRAAG